MHQDPPNHCSSDGTNVVREVRLTDEQTSFSQELMADTDSTVEHCQGLAENASMEDMLNGYERFFHDVIDGEHGSTAAYWATYMCTLSTVSIVSYSGQSEQTTLMSTSVYYQEWLEYALH